MHLVLSWFCAHCASLCLLLALDHGPSLELGKRTMLLDPYGVADSEFVLIVVSVIIFGAANCLFQQRVGKAAFHAYYDRLVLLVAHHDTLQHAFRHSALLTSLGSRGVFGA